MPMRPDPEKLRAALKAAFPDADVHNELTSAMCNAVSQGDLMTSLANKPGQ